MSREPEICQKAEPGTQIFCPQNRERKVGKTAVPLPDGLSKYASLRMIVANQSPAVMSCLTLGTVDILHHWLRPLRSRTGQSPPSRLGTKREFPVLTSVMACFFKRLDSYVDSYMGNICACTSFTEEWSYSLLVFSEKL